MLINLQDPGLLNVPAPPPPHPTQTVEYSQPVSAMSREQSKKPASLNLFLSLIGLLLLVGSLFVPWYCYQYELNNVSDQEVENTEWQEGLWGVEFERTGAYPESDSTTWVEEDDEVAVLYKCLFACTIVATILGASAFIVLVIVRKPASFTPRRRKMGIVLNAAAAILVVVLIVAHMIVLPGGHEKTLGEEVERDEIASALLTTGPWDSYLGTNEGGTTVGSDIVKSSSTWHPSIGWFLAIGAAIFFAVATVSLFSVGKGKKTESLSNTEGTTNVPSVPVPTTLPSMPSPLLPRQQAQQPGMPPHQHHTAPPQSPAPSLGLQPQHHNQAPPPPLPVPETFGQAQEGSTLSSPPPPSQVKCPQCSTVIKLGQSSVTQDGKTKIQCPSCGTSGTL